jgi:hypothetical protein
MAGRTLELVLGEQSHALVPVDVSRPHRHRARFAWPEGAHTARLVARGDGPEVELASVALPATGPRAEVDELEVELTLFPGGTTMATFTDVASRASTSAAFRLG